MPYDIFGNPVTKPTQEEIEAGRRLRSFYFGFAVGFIVCFGIML